MLANRNYHVFTFPAVLRVKSFRQRCAMIPAARASPRTLIMVRNLSLQREGKTKCHNTTSPRTDSILWNLGFSIISTYRIQSMATISVMSSGGRPTDVSTITMVTRPAWGIPAAPMLAAVAVILEDGETWGELEIKTERKWADSRLLQCLLCIFIKF